MNIKKFNKLFKFVISLVIGILVLPMSTTQAAKSHKSFVQSEPVRIFFSPANVAFDTDATLSLMLDAHSERIAFVLINLAFNQSKIQLADEIQTADSLKIVMQKTTMAIANPTGRIT